MTIYEVIQEFFTELFPAPILLEYEEIFTLMYLFLTLVLIFTFLLLPLWKLATFFLRSGKR